MASGVLTGVLASTLLISLVSIAHGDDGGDGEPPLAHGEPPLGHGGNPDRCYVSPPEMECIHIILELILKVSVYEYLQRNPRTKRQAPWFNPFRHVDFPRDKCVGYGLGLLSSIDIRDSLSYCVSSYGNASAPAYVPSSPKQMYKDMCAENVRIKEQVEDQ